MVTEDQIFGRWISYEVFTLMNGMNSLKMGCGELAKLMPSTMGRCNNKVPSRCREQHSSHIKSAGTLILDFPDSRTIKNKFVVNYSMVFCYSSKNRLRHWRIATFGIPNYFHLYPNCVIINIWFLLFFSHLYKAIVK